MHRRLQGGPGKWLLTGMLAVAMGAGIVPVAHPQDFTIEQFRSDITIDQDGSVHVTETIKVFFDRRKHGIYREIPVRYINELGKKTTMPISVKSVTHQGGRKWTYKVSRKGNIINIRIGHPDKYVSGRQVYVISYLVRNAVRHLEDCDEIYWNVTGDRWRARIKKALAVVRLNTSPGASEVSGACYTGAYGSTESACTFRSLENGASFSTERTLEAGEGFTVGMGWDKGIVAGPSSWQRFLWTINPGENWVFLIPVFALVYLSVGWYRRGRDPRVREAITVMYKPPESDGKPLTPAQVGVLVDERFDQRDLTSSLIGLAEKGYIELRELRHESGVPLFGSLDYELVKRKEPDKRLTLFEQTLMADIFGAGVDHVAMSELRNRFYVNLDTLKKIMFRDLVRKGFFTVNPQRVMANYGLVGFGIVMATMATLPFLSPLSPWKLVVAGWVTGLMVIAFGKVMPAKTKLGALTRIKIQGFQEFMNRADRDRLERMGKDVFYKYLPYAISLGVVDHWVKAFDGLLTEPPSWYVGGPSIQRFNVANFSTSLSAATSHLGSAMFSSPRGSGSSGGGFSGGGGGGGGGGSW